MPACDGLGAAIALRGAGIEDFRILDPRDTNSSFEPQIVHKRQRRLTGIDEIVLSLMAKRLTTGEIVAHFVDVYGATVSKDTISRITDKEIAEMTKGCDRPMEPVYPVMFIASINAGYLRAIRVLGHFPTEQAAIWHQFRVGRGRRTRTYPGS